MTEHVNDDRIDAHLDGIDAAADWQPVSGDKLVELVGPTSAAIIEANYQRRRKDMRRWWSATALLRKSGSGGKRPMSCG
jgi:hypothetical protein